MSHQRSPSWRLRTATLVAGVAYVTIGVVTAAMNGPRLVAWAVSGAVFLSHAIIARPRDRHSIVSAALQVAVGAAIGGLLLALVGPIRSHWAEPNHARLLLLSVIAWPMLAGLPAFAVAFVIEYFIARTQLVTSSWQ